MRRIAALVLLVVLGRDADIYAYADEISAASLDSCLLSWKADPFRTELMPGQTYIPKEHQAYRNDSGSIVCARKYVYEYLCASFWRGGDDDWDRCAAERSAALIDQYNTEWRDFEAEAPGLGSDTEEVFETLQAKLQECGNLKDENERRSEAFCKLQSYSQALAVLKFTRLIGAVQ